MNTPQKIVTLIILILTPLVALVILLRGPTLLACEGQPINLALSPGSQYQIWGDNTVTQLFVAPRNNLNRLDLFLQTYFRQNTTDVTISLTEVSVEHGQLTTRAAPRFQTTFNAAQLPPQGWRTFTFPTLVDSANKTYAIVIASPQARPGNAITIGGIAQADPYAPGPAFMGQSPFPGDIAFRACFQMSIVEKLAILAGQVTQHRPSFWGNAAFYVVILLLYVLLLVLLFWQLAKQAIT